jgi:ABC-type uncharacterized transport system auxiliary subunit
MNVHVHRLTVAAWLLALAGCVPQLLPEPPPPPRSFDFGPLPDAAPEPLPFAVRLTGVQTPSWLDSRDILYRRLDEQPGALHAYARSAWVAPPAELLGERLKHKLNEAMPNDRRPDHALYVELVTFEHVYANTREAWVTVRARASVDGPEHAAEHSFTLRRDVRPDVHGATGGLPAAADELVEQIGQWLRQLDTAGADAEADAAR